MNIAECMLMLYFDGVFYYFLAWYIDNVFPGEFGVPRKWYFFIQARWESTISLVRHFVKSHFPRFIFNFVANHSLSNSLHFGQENLSEISAKKFTKDKKNQTKR